MKNRILNELMIFSSLSVLALVLVVLLSGCGANSPATTPVAGATPEGLAIVGSQASDGLVIKSRAVLTLNTESNSVAQKLMNRVFPSAFAASGQTVVTVSNSENTSMTLNTNSLNIPGIKNELLSFGSLSISSLFDNNLKVCGSNGKTKCGTAVIHIYSAGAGGAGLWNNSDSYGAPLYGSLSGTNANSAFGLNTEGAITLQTLTIPSNKNVLRQSDFTTTPAYDIKADFTNAGVGSYSTTIIIEYGLST